VVDLYARVNSLNVSATFVFPGIFVTGNTKNNDGSHNNNNGGSCYVMWIG